MIWFSADPHFGHRAMLLYCAGRAVFDSVEAMNETLVMRWNQRVAPRDEVYLLGDVSFMPTAKTKELLLRLNGRLHLVAGNHDPKQIRKLDRWESVSDYLERRIDGQKLIMSHYPMLTWKNAHHGSWMLHGHSHGNIVETTTRTDVGIDTTTDLAPISWPEVQDRMKGRTYAPVDHHLPANPQGSEDRR